MLLFSVIFLLFVLVYCKRTPLSYHSIQKLDSAKAEFAKAEFAKANNCSAEFAKVNDCFAELGGGSLVSVRF